MGPHTAGLSATDQQSRTVMFDSRESMGPLRSLASRRSVFKVRLSGGIAELSTHEDGIGVPVRSFLEISKYDSLEKFANPAK